MLEIETIEKTKTEIDEELLTSSEEKGYTYLHCTFATPRTPDSCGWWVNISRTSFLTCGDKKLELIDALNVPYAPNKHISNKVGKNHQFTLIFPQLPDGWDMFNFVEVLFNKTTGFGAHNIVRNNFGVYQIVFH